MRGEPAAEWGQREETVPRRPCHPSRGGALGTGGQEGAAGLLPGRQALLRARVLGSCWTGKAWLSATPYVPRICCSTTQQPLRFPEPRVSLQGPIPTTFPPLN